jgi:hypothetical protein
MRFVLLEDVQCVNFSASPFCHSERSEESKKKIEGEKTWILRFAQNDRDSRQCIGNLAAQFN